MRERELFVSSFLLISSRSERWIVDRATLHQARAEDIQFADDPEYLDYLPIYFANCMCFIISVSCGTEKSGVP